MIELFAGGGRLSRYFLQAGFDVMAVDKGVRNCQVEVPLHLMNLLDMHCQRQLLDQLSDERVVFVYLRPPCVTSTRSTRSSRPLLRSDALPEGLPDPPSSWSQKLKEENELYKFSAKVFQVCADKGIAVVCENPHRSFMWRVPSFYSLASSGYVTYDECAYGTGRPLRQRLVGRHVDLSTMACLCQRDHVHVPLQLSCKGANRHQTMRAPPTIFCQRLVNIVSTIARRKEFVVEALVGGDGCPPSTSLTSSLDRQSRKKTPPLMSEFFIIVQIMTDKSLEVDTMTTHSYDGVRCSAKVLDCFDSGDKANPWTIRLGLYRSPEKWIADALDLQHPFDGMGFLKEDTGLAINHLVTMGPSNVALQRRRFLDFYHDLAKKNIHEEFMLHQRMPGAVAQIMSGKNILVLKHMMFMTGCEDKHLIDDLTNGFPLVGDLPRSYEYEAFHKAMPMKVETLLGMSRSIQDRIIAKTVSLGDDELDQAVLNGTQDEVSKGWLTGPHSRSELDVLLGTKWIPSRRFALRQKNKIRLIDDMSSSFVNMAVGTSERIDLESVDSYLSLVKAWYRASVGHNGKCSDFVGRCFDLTSAYRQLAVAPESYPVAVVAIWNSVVRSVEFYKLLALPFGSVASVYGFLRTSRALRNIAVRGLLLPVTCYFDDFPILADNDTKDEFEAVFVEFMDIVGFQVSTDFNKVMPFNEIVELLGVQVDLSDVPRGSLVVRNKPGRVDEIRALVDGYLSSNSLSPSAAASLRGKIQFTEGQHYLRLGCLAARVIGERASSLTKATSLTDELAWALRWIIHILDVAPERTISLRPLGRPALIATDGACEGAEFEHVTIGGFLYIQGHRPSYFFSEVPADVVKIWKGEGRSQTIFQAELLPILVASNIWKESLRGMPVVFFVDNEAARLCMISFSTSSRAALRIVVGWGRIAAETMMKAWFARVPSCSNPADSASRGKCAEMEQRWGATRVDAGDLRELIASCVL